jgi:hypothetical protein
LRTGCCIGSISVFIGVNLILYKADGQLQDMENFTSAVCMGISTEGNEGNKEGENLRSIRLLLFQDFIRHFTVFTSGASP